MPGQIVTGFQINGVDIGNNTGQLVEKSYLIDMYPNLVNTIDSPGLWAWGDNTSGQLGDNTNGTPRSSPVQTVAAAFNWKQISVNPGIGRHTSAIKTDGTLWTWGDNTYGQLGDNTVVAKSSPVQTVSGGTNWKQVSVGGYNTAAIKTDGTLWTWGYNTLGAVGDNTVTHKSSPVQTVAAGSNWKQIVVAANSMHAIKTDGTLWSWGSNSAGQLGDNTSTAVPKSSPVQTVAGGSTWVQLASNIYLTPSAIKTDGTLWLWGSNSSGHIGDNTITDRSSPVQTVSGGTNWKQVCGSGRNTCAIKTDGTLWVWGYNGSGQLGNNNGAIAAVSSPIQTVAGGSNWKTAFTGFDTLGAIKTDGSLWMWGDNFYGQLGNNNGAVAMISSPIQTVGAGNNWRSLEIGYYYTFAIAEVTSL